MGKSKFVSSPANIQFIFRAKGIVIREKDTTREVAGKVEGLASHMTSHTRDMLAMLI
jgi:hypothetical protein